MLGNAARGSVAATLGAPGDILGLLSDKQPLPTSQNILDYIPPVGSDKALTGMAETMGGFVPAPGSAGLVRAAKTVANPMTYGRAFAQAQAPAVMSPITAWHGSPHKFRKFDNSKMGTGEGAQAYGAGAYLADNQNIAKSYKKQLSQSGPTNYAEFDGKRIYADGNENPGDWVAISYLLDAQETAKRTGTPIRDIAAKMALEDGDAGTAEYLSTFPEKIKLGIDKKYQGGHLYKVDVPDEAVANMLLWDKPLSHQTDFVKNAIAKSGLDFSDYQNIEGSAVYDLLQGSLGGQRAASERLKSLGIPGIRYLDAGSRGAGQGTMNTVVFDDSIIKILERNGVPLGLLAD